jgi:Na+/proline symporter
MLYATIAALAASLLFFIWIALRDRAPVASLDEYLTARGSQSALTLGLSFLASGLGGWILFVPPEIGAFVGPVAVIGYALAAALPFWVRARDSPAHAPGAHHRRIRARALRRRPAPLGHRPVGALHAVLYHG